MRTDREFRWAEYGRGDPVLLFLHGMMGRADDWRVTACELQSVCRVLALGLPIFEPELSEPTVAGLAAHVGRFLDMRGVPEVIVGGNSLGGHVALVLALAEPARVRGLVLTGSSGLSGGGVTRNVPRALSAAFLRARMEEVFFDPSLVTDDMVEAARGALRPLPSLLRALRFIRDARTHVLDHRLGDVRVPALLVWGEHDRITPLDRGARRFERLLPASELVVIPACGHAPMLEAPVRFAAAIREWLGRQSMLRATASAVAREPPAAFA